MKKLIIKKSNYPNEKGNYIVWLNVEGKHSSMWAGIFKGTYKNCMQFKKDFKKC